MRRWQITVSRSWWMRPEDIDEARARAAMERAQEELRQKHSIQEYYRTQAVLARAISRLKEKNRTHINL